METQELARKQRISRIIKNTRIAEARRRALAKGFRARLEADLLSRGIAMGPGQDALIDAAVSAHVQVQELSNLFLRAHASTKQLAQLGLARGSLARVLRALGVVGGEAEPEEAATAVAPGTAPVLTQPPKNATPSQLRAWSAGYVQSRGAAAGANGSTQDASGEEPPA